MPLVDELQLAGVHEPLSFTVRRGDFTVAINLEINSGTVVGANAAAFWRREGGSAFLTLRRETATDERDKSSGLAVELQLGSPAFDQRVYIDSDAPDDEVRRLLGPSSPREVIQELVGLCHEVKFSTGALLLDFGKPQGKHYDGPQLARALDLMERVWRNGPLQATAQPRKGDGLVGLGLAALVGSIVVFWSATLRWSLGAGPNAMALVALFLAGNLLWPLARSMTSGHSGSGRSARVVLALLCANLAFAGTSVLLGVNALLDRQPVVEVQGRVVGVGSYDDEDGTWSISIAWDDGSEHTYHLKQASEPGRPATRREHPGFIWTWGLEVLLR